MNILLLRARIESSRTPYPLMLSYITGARANELCRPGNREAYSSDSIIALDSTKCPDCLHELSENRQYCRGKDCVCRTCRPSISKTRSVGPLRSDVEYDSFIDPDTGQTTECVKIRLVVLKRRSPQIIRRIISLPLTDAEPWAKYLSRYFDSLSLTDPLLDMARYTLNDVIREAGFYDELKKEENLTDPKNPLRHFRHNHLIEYYGLDPYQNHVYFGWGFGASGLLNAGASSTSSKYDHLNWQLYFKKLLKPLPKPFMAPVHETEVTA